MCYWRKFCLIIEVPNIEDMRQDPKNRYHKAHIYTFNPETLIALGKKAGFQVFRKSIAPLHGNILIIFEKTVENQNSSADLNDNFKKITTHLNRHTNLHHFTSIVPYKKVLHNACVAIAERFAIRKLHNPGGHPKSPTCGHLKIPHPAATFKT